MKVDTMRAIDFWVGVPLTFVGTVVKRLVSFSPRRVKPHNVLFIELSEMGSAVLVDPALRKMRDAGTNIFFVIFAKNKPSLQLLHTVKDENIFTIRENSLSALAVDTVKFLLWCRKRKIDTVIDLELFSRFTALLAGFCGAKNVVGFHPYHQEGLYRGDMLTRKVSYNPQMHITKNFIALIHAALAEKPELPFSKVLITGEECTLARAEISDEAKSSLAQKVDAVYPGWQEKGLKIVLINPNASELLTQRRWMRDRYAELIRRICDRWENALVLITGAPAEAEEAAELVQNVGRDRCRSFAGKVKLLELLPLYAISQLMVTNDSGPAHFASVTDMPTIVIFGPETPALYASLGDTTPIWAGLACSPCVSAYNHRKTPCVDNVCLQAITVEQVFDTVVKRLDGKM